MFRDIDQNDDMKTPDDVLLELMNILLCHFKLKVEILNEIKK